MFYLRYNDQYVCSGILFHVDKRCAVSFRTYKDALYYRQHLQEQYKLTGISMVKR